MSKKVLVVSRWTTRTWQPRTLEGHVKVSIVRADDNGLERSGCLGLFFLISHPLHLVGVGLVSRDNQPAVPAHAASGPLQVHVKSLHGFDARSHLLSSGSQALHRDPLGEQRRAVVDLVVHANADALDAGRGTRRRAEVEHKMETWWRPLCVSGCTSERSVGVANGGIEYLNRVSLLYFQLTI